MGVEKSLTFNPDQKHWANQTFHVILYLDTNVNSEIWQLR